VIRQQPTWYLALITLLTIGLDQFTKYLIVSNLVLGESWMPWDWLASIVTITHVHNSGAAFGIFPAGGIVFTAIGVIVVGAIVYYYHQLPRGQWLARTALSLQLGGAIGNLTDRFRQGYVTDFINFEYFPVFNVADSAIVVGVSLLVVLMAIEERREAKLMAEGEAALIGVERDAIGSVEHPDSTTP
jgi:signal peptidase II